MTSKNFLPAYKRRETQIGRRNTLQCHKRTKAVKATPEEQVRQRILHWLIKQKKWPRLHIKVEENHSWVGNSNRQRIRSDIELMDDQRHTLVVIECKAPEVLLDAAVEQQAREYAIKSKATYIWISNGDQHKFFVRSPQSKNGWKPTEHLKPLGADYPPPTVNFEFPNANDSKAVRRYFQRSFPGKGYEDLDYSDQSIVLSVHKLLFDTKKKLPFSHSGVHVLEDRGADMQEFSTAGGKWRNLYGDFIAATSGRVEALSVAIARWGGVNDGLRLCVGVRKPDRSHHALQMDMAHSEWDESLKCWHVYHDGKMANIKREAVFEAVEESGAGDWLEKKPGYIYLGDLYWADKATWRNSKRFLANVLHYGIIRTNLREANLARK